ncbi:MAG: hypothetical protein ACI8X5_002439 [Planctomycetota bacterium]|jgi:hypothetical protein
MRRIITPLTSLLIVLASSCSGSEEGVPVTPTQPAESVVEAPKEESAPTKPAPAEQTTFVLRGTVGDPWGDPIEAARVRIVPLGGADDGGVVAEVQSDAKGAYEVELSSRGPWTVYAWQEEMGADSIDVALMRARGSTKAPKLRLAGHGVLKGRLLDASGEPLPEVLVVAFSRNILHQEVFGGSDHFELESLPLFAPMLDSSHYIRGKGFQYLETHSASDGSFYLGGLAPGEYMIYSPSIGTDPWVDPNRDWYTASAGEIELRAKLCSLVISIADDGVGGTGSSKRRLGPLMIFPVVPNERGGAAVIGRSQEVHGSERNVFWVKPGDYVARATTFPPQGQWDVTLHTEGKLRILPGVASQSYLLEFAPEDRPTGRLRVNVQVPDSFDKPKAFHLLSVETGRTVECSEYSSFPQPLYGEWLDIPEGEYLVALFPFQDYTGREDVVDMARIYRRVVIEAGKDTECSIESTFGGRFRLSLDADRFVLGKELTKPEEFSSTDWELLLRQFAESTGATIVVHREDGGPALDLRMEDPSDFMGKRRDFMLAGEIFENLEPIEPGNYTLWVISEGFKLCGVPLTIKAGELTPITARLESE